ncbi:MAG: DUF1232 domain-containing protein [Chloroflexota bacterium]
MTEKPKRSEVPPPQRGIGFFRQLLEQVRLSFALVTDNRVPLVLKVIPFLAVAYVISPIDLIPDIFPILGQLDDLGVVMVGISVFTQLAPAEIVAGHLARLRSGAPYKVKRDGDGPIIDVQADHSDEQQTADDFHSGAYRS